MSNIVVNVDKVAMHLLAAAKLPDMRSVSNIALNPSLCKVNVNKVKQNYRIVLILVASCSFPCTLLLY